MTLGHDEGITLDHKIEDAIDQYCDRRDQAWRDVVEAKPALRAAGRLGELIISTAEELTFEDQEWDSTSLWADLRDVASMPLIRDLVKEEIQIALARKFAPHTGEMADRCLDLTLEVLGKKPGEPVLKYLRRLSRCYIAGLLPECVMICRAVLENAVNEVFSRKNTTVPATMGAKLRTARQLQWLTESGRQKAEQVWHRGNMAVHYDPGGVRNVPETVR
jgi:hypothetical protein